MARRLVNDEHPMFRVLVVERKRRDNPDWDRGNLASPRFLWDGPEYSTAYGPYNTLGAARGQLTFHTVDVYGRPRDGVVSGRIEQAHTTWTPEGEQPRPDLATVAAAYRHAADLISTADELRNYTDDHMGDINEAADFLRRRADELHPAEENDQ